MRQRKSAGASRRAVARSATPVAIRAERGAVGDVELHAAARAARELVERRPERQRPEAHARQRQLLARQLRERRDPVVAVEERRADDLERPRRAAPLGQVGPLDQTLPGIDQRRAGVGMFGDGITQGSPVSTKFIARRQPRIGTTVRSQSIGRANRAPPHGIPARRRRAISPIVMPWRTGTAPSPTNDSQPGRRCRPRSPRPRAGSADRARRPPRRRGRRLQRQHHRPDVRVVAAADVLQVDDQHVDAAEIGGRRRQRLERLAVEADDRDAGAAIVLVVDADHVLRLAAHAVLGPEEARRPDADLDQPIDDVGQIGRRRSPDDRAPRPGGPAGGRACRCREHRARSLRSRPHLTPSPHRHQFPAPLPCSRRSRRPAVPPSRP